MSAVWHIELFGGLRATAHERVVTRFRTNKTGALLGYLALYRNHPHAREALVGRIWPDADPDAGRLSLRVSLNSLRRQLEPPGVPAGSILHASRACVQLNPAAVSTDVAQFEELLARAARTQEPGERIEHLANAVACWCGELLTGYYEDWIVAEQQRLSDAYLGAVGRLRDALAAEGETARAIDYANRAVTIVPWLEEPNLALMRLYAAAGRPADALDQYRRLKVALRDAQDEAPSAEARELAERIGQSCTWDRPQALRTLRMRTEDSRRYGDRAPNIPQTFTRLFGRDTEIALLVSLLSPDQPLARRVVTITGPGGCGKTRLAQEVAASLSASFPGGIWFVPLQAVTDPDLIADAVAATIGAAPAPGVEAAERTVAFFNNTGGRSLLVLDNYEQLLYSGIEIVRLLMSRVGPLSLLLTSRQRLELEGEQELALEPLAVPTLATPHIGREAGWPPEELVRFPSVQMFVDRAQASRPDFQVTKGNAESVAVLCSRLDGIPLAIELAAAWSQVLTPAQMVRRLSCDLDILSSSRRDLPARHRSLHAAMDWSFRLLPQGEQGFFAALSIFRGGWTLESAEAICAEPRVLDWLRELRSRSLVLAQQECEAMRYRLLETVREFAWERLSEARRAHLAARHARHFLALAEDSAAATSAGADADWSSRLEVENENLRAALERCLGEGPFRDTKSGLRLASALWPFWERTGRISEGRRWLRKALHSGDAAEIPARARGLYGAASLAATQGDLPDAQTMAEASLGVWRSLGDLQRAADSLTLLGRIVYEHGDLERSLALLDESVGICRCAGYRAGLACALAWVGRLRSVHGEYAVADAAIEESRALQEFLDDPAGLARTLYHAGMLAHRRLEHARSLTLYERALELYERLDDRPMAAEVLGAIGIVARLQRNDALAQRALEASLALNRELMVQGGAAQCLRNLGSLAREQAEYERAAPLLEEAIAIFRRMRSPAGIADAVGSLGLCLLYQGDLPRARVLLEECVEIRRDLGDWLDLEESKYVLAQVAMVEGRMDAARHLLRECLPMAEGVDIEIARIYYGLAAVELRSGDCVEAQACAQQGLARSRWDDSRVVCLEGLEVFAELRLAQQCCRQAASLLAAADALRREHGMPVHAVYRDGRARLKEELRVRLGSDFDAAWSAGAGWSWAEAVAHGMCCEA